MKYLIIWLALTVVVIIGTGSRHWLAYRRLAKLGVQEQATILEAVPNAYEIFRYEYHVAGRTFQGEMTPWYPNPSFDVLKAGQALVIYYDPEHPERSVAGDPGLVFNEETLGVEVYAAGFSILFAIFLALKWAFRMWRNRGKQSIATPAT